MKNLIIKIITEESKKLLTESGIRDINKIAKRYKKAKIYFHQDLDGVTTAIAMKNYLEQNGIDVVDCEVIQYGSKEFAIKKPEGEGNIMPVLVDFAHGKPMFVIHSDHHDSQAGVESETKTNFRSARSNVETISQIVSPQEIFPSEDINLISIVDSANFAKNEITPDMVMNFLYKFDKDSSLQKNKIMMGLVVNKLLLAYKNNPNFLETLVMKSKPSLFSILTNIKKIAKEQGFATIETMTKNQEKFLENRSKEGVIQKTGNVISQFGLGSMKKGSYDRYVPFKLNPDADFLVTGLGGQVGMVQASCNPFKEERSLKGINLGEIKDEVLKIFKPELEKEILNFRVIKKIAEREATPESVGFTSKDMMAIYGKMPSFNVEKQTINGYDFLLANSGGHKCITNISGINFLYSGYDKPYTKDLPQETLPIANYEGHNSFVKEIKQKLLKFRKLSERQIETALNQIKKEKNNLEDDFTNLKERTYSDLVKDMKDTFVNILNKKIENENYNNLDENYFYVTKKTIIKNPINKLIDNKKIIKEQKIKLPIVISDVWQSPIKGDGDLLHSFERRKKDKKGAYMATKIMEKLKEVYAAGVNPDVTNLKLDVDSKNYTVSWSATIDESKIKDENGQPIAFLGVGTRGSAGGSADRRALNQVEPYKSQITKNGAKNITLLLDFKNQKGLYIRQYFFKYALPDKYPPHPADTENYIRTAEPTTISLQGDKINQETNVSDQSNKSNMETPNQSQNAEPKNLFDKLKQQFGSLFGIEVQNTENKPSESNQEKQPQDQSSETENLNVSNVDSDFTEITKKVIANFEGGYWNGSTSENEKTSKMGICSNHPEGSMGKSTETMFGLDRYNGNIESSPEGKEFFEIIDQEKKDLGMSEFCKKWKWLYRGGDKQQKLLELAVKIMKRSFDRNMSNFVKDEKVKQKIMSNKGLLVHMTYACWNGPGFFQKFAKALTEAVNDGKSDSELIDVAIQSRAKTGLLNKDKVEAAIRNPDGMKTV